MQILVFPFLLAALVSVGIWWFKPAKKSRFQSKTSWGPVNPVSESFDWKAQSPSQYRPFKSTYHLTMNVTRTDRQEWLKIDDLYLSSMKNHKRIMDENPSHTCVTQKSRETNMAVHEMYDFVMDTLVQRYPKYFVPQGSSVENTIRNTKVPRFAPKDMDPSECIRSLAGTIQEDVFVLQYDSEVEEYRLRATSGIAGLGFEWRDKVGLKLTDIHGPVPGYKEKLQTSMNRYFHKIKPGNFTQRVTYGLMIGDREDLFSSGNDSFAKTPNRTVRPSAFDINNLDFDNQVFVRLERQVLFRLPISGFLGFTIRTYMYSLGELKREGLGEACAEALEAWPEDTSRYKGRHLWGDSVFSYLRS